MFDSWLNDTSSCCHPVLNRHVEETLFPWPPPSFPLLGNEANVEVPMSFDTSVPLAVVYKL